MRLIWGWAVLAALLLVLLALEVLPAAEQAPSGLLRSKELKSPSDWIKEEQISVYPQQVIINVQGATWAKFTDTNSMDPFLDEKAHALEILPDNPDSILPGDVIAYDTVYGTIIHRVLEKGKDKEGTYYLVKGDNNTFVDPLKVRYSDIRGVVVAVIY